MLGFRRKHDQSPSIVQVAKSLVSDALRLVRVELDLVKARFSQMLRRTGIAVGILLAAAFVATLGLVGLLVTVGIALAIVLPAWAAALIVAGALVLGGAATSPSARSRSKIQYAAVASTKKMATRISTAFLPASIAAWTTPPAFGSFFSSFWRPTRMSCLMPVEFFAALPSCWRVCGTFPIACST